MHALWTVAHGTSLAGVCYAMYPFRVAGGPGDGRPPEPRWRPVASNLLLDAVVSGMLLVAALLLTVFSAHRRDHPSSSPASGLARAVPVALAATVAFDAVSIYLGEGYWNHYLVELAVPLALAAGLAAERRPRAARVTGGLVVASAAAAVLVAGPHPTPGGGNALGAAIRAVSSPHDTIVTIWGRADVTQASGLRSPYPYLWSLPARTLDPHVRLLAATLAGPAAPTWFVDWTGTGLHGTNTSRLDRGPPSRLPPRGRPARGQGLPPQRRHRHAPVTGPVPRRLTPRSPSRGALP